MGYIYLIVTFNIESKYYFKSNFELEEKTSNNAALKKIRKYRKMENRNSINLADFITVQKKSKKNSKKQNNKPQQSKKALILQQELVRCNEERLKEAPKTNMLVDRIVGAGMINAGNTCFINATLQSLFRLPSFKDVIKSYKSNQKWCTQGNECVMCALAKSYKQSLGHSPFQPTSIISKLNYICERMNVGKQQDAHEFLRYLLESMGSSCSNNFNGPTSINKLFEGHMSTNLKCNACGNVSKTSSSFEDICVDIEKSESISQSLDAYFASEKLNDFKCDSCKEICTTKKYSIQSPPKSLCVQVNRFTYQGKLNKLITIDPRISLSKYSTQEGEETSWNYRLVSMINHIGDNRNCGHYTAICLSEDKKFYKFDDDKVDSMLPEDVFPTTDCYVIFYELED